MSAHRGWIVAVAAVLLLEVVGFALGRVLRGRRGEERDRGGGAAPS